MRYRLDAPLDFMVGTNVEAETKRILRDLVAKTKAMVIVDGIDPQALFWRVHMTQDVYNSTLSVTASDTEIKYPFSDRLSCDIKEWLDEKGENDETVLLSDLQEVS